MLGADERCKKFKEKYFSDVPSVRLNEDLEVVGCKKEGEGR